MGCDIHIVLERRKAAGPWIGLWSSDEIPGRRIRVAQRDYAFFAEVASVRGSSSATMYPQNIPEDVSALAWAQYMRAPTDHHSASHLSVKDFCDAWVRANPTDKEVRPEFAANDLLGVDGSWPAGCEYRLVFWFDN